jgi:hypothetical protein
LVTCFFPLKSSTFNFPTTTTTNTKIIQYLKLTMTSKLVFFQYSIHKISSLSQFGIQTSLSYLEHLNKTQLIFFSCHNRKR